MTPEEFKSKRIALGLTQKGLAILLNSHPVSVQKWEAPPEQKSARKPDPIASRMLELMHQPGRPKDWPAPPDTQA